MIHIHLSVPPYSVHHSPHLIFDKVFSTWGEARDFVKLIGIKAEGLERVLDNEEDEYVGCELEVLDIKGRGYLGATLVIEGNERSHTFQERFKDLKVNKAYVTLDRLGHWIDVQINGEQLDGTTTWMNLQILPEFNFEFRNANDE